MDTPGPVLREPNGAGELTPDQLESFSFGSGRVEGPAFSQIQSQLSSFVSLQWVSAEFCPGDLWTFETFYPLWTGQLIRLS